MIDASKIIGYEGLFAHRLRELMKENKITQKELADKIGTTRQAVSQYMDGSVQPNLEKLYKIASYFKITSDYLLGISKSKSIDTDDKSISKKLGLSDSALSVIKNIYYKDEDGGKKSPLIDIINLLFEEVYREYKKFDEGSIYSTLIYALKSYLEEEIDENSFFECREGKMTPSTIRLKGGGSASVKQQFLLDEEQSNAVRYLSGERMQQVRNLALLDSARRLKEKIRDDFKDIK